MWILKKILIRLGMKMSVPFSSKLYSKNISLRNHEHQSEAILTIINIKINKTTTDDQMAM